MECLTNKDVYITGKKDVMIAAQEPWAFFLSSLLFFSEIVLTLFVLALILIASARKGNFRGHALLGKSPCFGLIFPLVLLLVFSSFTFRE